MPNTIEVDQDAWHYHVYQWWQRHGGRNRRGYRENLCHYMRVLLIWVPLFWFFKVPIYKGVRAWMPAGFILWLIAVWQIPPIRTDLLVLPPLWTVFGYARFHEEQTNRFLRRIGPPFVFIWNHGLKTFLWWFLTARKLRVVYPWSVMVVIGLASTVYWLINSFGLIKSLVYVGIVIGTNVGVAFLIVTISWLSSVKESKRKQRPNWSSYSSTPQVNKCGTSTLKIAGHYVMAKKKRICPFINLPSEKGG